MGRMIVDKKYQIIIYWSSEDNAYVAEVPELPGCMADGGTYQEALANAEHIIENGSKLPRKSIDPSLSRRALRMPDK